MYTPRLLSFALTLVTIAACGDDGGMADTSVADSGSPPDTSLDTATPPDAAPDAAADAVADALPELMGIDAVLSAPDGAANVLIEDVLVTYVRPAIGADMPGFFVQSEATGPALFVQVDPSAVSAGDMVTFRVTEVETRIGHKRASVIDGLVVSSSDNDLSGLVQDVSAATDLASSLGDYAHELIAVDLTITGTPEAAGEAFTRAVVETAGVTGSPNLQLRLPTTLWDSYPLATGCTLHVEATPYWAFMEFGQISAWDAAEISDLTCP